MLEAIVTIFGFFILWFVFGYVALQKFKHTFLKGKSYSKLYVSVGSGLTAVFLTPAIVIAGHQPLVVSVLLFPLFPQTGISFLVLSFVIYLFIAFRLYNKALNSNSLFKQDA